MSRIARKSDGRRIFTDEFKRDQIDRLRRGELTVAELSRKLGIAASLLQRWKRLMSPDAESMDVSRRRVLSTSGLRTDQYIRELQQLVGRQTVELELLRSEVEELRGKRRSRVASMR